MRPNLDPPRRCLQNLGVGLMAASGVVGRRGRGGRGPTGSDGLLLHLHIKMRVFQELWSFVSNFSCIFYGARRGAGASRMSGSGSPISIANLFAFLHFFLNVDVGLFCFSVVLIFCFQCL